MGISGRRRSQDGNIGGRYGRVRNETKRILPILAGCGEAIDSARGLRDTSAVPEQYQGRIWFFLARQHRLAYLQMPKVACTSLRAAICLMNHPHLARSEVFDGETIHQRREWNDMVAPNDRALRGCFRFTFVRHPLERFASFYRNKIASVAPEATAERFLRIGLRGGMSMEEAVDRVMAVPPAKLDPHIAPQSLLVFDGDIPRVDFIGRLEKFGDDLAVVESKCGIRFDLGRLNATRADAKPSTPGAGLSEGIRARLNALYRDDYAHFGYAP